MRLWGLWRGWRRSDSLGSQGERLAARTLKAAGCRILARNYRCPAGEADVIGLTGNTLVFAEVKTRSGDSFASPESAVDRRKQDRYRRVARYYLARVGRDDLAVRFDIIAVVIRPGHKPEIRHLADAFA